MLVGMREEREAAPCVCLFVCSRIALMDLLFEPPRCAGGKIYGKRERSWLQMKQKGVQNAAFLLLLDNFFEIMG
jgi:hypothetical protein